MAYLEMSDISKSFPGVKALQEVSFEVDEGEIVSLLGENGAGKSTLMNVLGGVISRDNGQIVINGNVVDIKNVRDAQQQKIAYIHQELSLFPQLSVKENLFIEKFPVNSIGLIDKKKMYNSAMDVISLFDMQIDPDEIVMNLSMGEQQLVEIASAVLKDSKILILDEPTSSLTEKECERLFHIMKKLKSENKIVILISHDIQRALEISDRVYVLRDGRNVGMNRSEHLNHDLVVQMMIGSKAGKHFLKTRRESSSEVVLEFKEVSSSKVNNVSLKLFKGEVLGLYGLIGAGRTELMNTLFGIDKIISGAIYHNGTLIQSLTPRQMLNNKFAYLTENRRDEGLFLEHGVNKNISITDLPKVSDGPFKVINTKKENDLTKALIELLSIVVPSTFQLAGRLSGGNQQKVVIAKWLHTNPEVFVMDEPTRGIDVGAKNEIYKIIDDIVKQGVSIILISSEIEEILGISDRVAVMANGTITGLFQGADINNTNIIHSAMKQGSTHHEYN